MSESRTSDARFLRVVGVGGIVWGAALLTAGPPIWRYLDARGPTEVDQIALKLLGSRHLVTGVVQLCFPGHFQRLEIAVDLIHTATMVALAAADPPRRRPALVTASVALASAAAGVAIRARSSRTSSASA